MNNKIDKKNLFLLSLFLIVGFFLRVIYLYKFAPKDINIPSGDASGYHILALNLLEYNQLAYEKDKPTAHREPLYPLFLYFVYKFIGKNLNSARLIQVLINVLSISLIYFIAKNLFDKITGLISTAIASFWPNFIYYTAAVLRETVFTFLLLLSIFLLIKNIRNKTQFFIKQIILGILCALTALTNSIGIFIFLVILIYLLAIGFSFKKIFFILISFLFLYSFWVYRNYKIFGSLVLGSTNGGKTFWDGTDIIPFEIRGLPEERDFFERTDDYIIGVSIKNEVERDKFFYKKAINYYITYPEKFFILAIKKFLKFWRFLPHKGRIYGVNEKFMFIVGLIYVPIFVLFIIGLYMFFSKTFSHESFIILLPIICFCLIYSIFWSQIRYRIPIEPYIIILASYSLKSLFITKQFK